MIREYRTICDLSEDFLTLTGVQDVAPGELGEVLLPNGETCVCQVLEADGDEVSAVFFNLPLGISPQTCKVRFLGYGLELPLSEDLLGRTWNSLGEPLDGGPAVLPEKYASAHVNPINPLARECSGQTMQIEKGEPFPLGEKRVISSDAHTSIATTVAQVARQAKIVGESKDLTIVISATGLPFEEREYLTDELRRRGLTAQTALFVSSPEEKEIRRHATVDTAMMAAEYFAFEKERHVLFIAAGEEIGADMTAERIGCYKGCAGSITMVSIVTE